MQQDARISTVCNILRRYFVNYGVPEEIACDGGPPYNSDEWRTFLKTWGISLRVSSAYYPQSNGRAEAAVKHMKRILTTNVSPNGSLDTDEVAKALLLHRNTPPPDIGASPSELLFARPLNDHLPNPTKFRREWLELADMRERAINQRFLNNMKHTENRQQLNPLRIGEHVSIQNQHGHKPLRWDNTGTIVETLPHRQYRVLVDGSRRTTLRNRRYLRKISTDSRNLAHDDTLPDDLPNRIRIHSPQSPTNSNPVRPDSQQHPQIQITPTPPSTPGTQIKNEPLKMTDTGQNERSEARSRPIRNRRLPSRFKDFQLG